MSDADLHDDLAPKALLLAACAAGQPSKVKRALDHGANPNAMDRHGWAALHHLAKGTCERATTQRTILKMLVQAGADLDQMASDHVESQELATPICVAALEHKWDLVEALAKQGASLTRLVPTTTSSAYVWDELSVLCLTVRAGPTRTVKVLLDHGANVEDVEYHQTALTLAVWSLGNTRNPQDVQDLTNTIDLLIRYGASVTGRKVPSEDRDELYNTPLAIAVIERCPSMVNRLIDAGAWANDDRWRHPDHQNDLAKQAIRSGHPEALERLFQEGLGQAWSPWTWGYLVTDALEAIEKPTLRVTETITPERVQRQRQLLVRIEEQHLRRTMAATPQALPPPPARPRL